MTREEHQAEAIRLTPACGSRPTQEWFYHMFSTYDDDRLVSFLERSERSQSFIEKLDGKKDANLETARDTIKRILQERKNDC